MNPLQHNGAEHLAALASALSEPTSGMALLRRLLMIGGTALASRGYVDASLVEPAVGLLLILASWVAGDVARARALDAIPPHATER